MRPLGNNVVKLWGTVVIFTNVSHFLCRTKKKQAVVLGSGLKEFVAVSQHPDHKPLWLLNAYLLQPLVLPPAQLGQKGACVWGINARCSASGRAIEVGSNSWQRWACAKQHALSRADLGNSGMLLTCGATGRGLLCGSDHSILRLQSQVWKRMFTSCLKNNECFLWLQSRGDCRNGFVAITDVHSHP